MFAEFRQIVKETLKEKGLTYEQLATITGLKESTIKSFMASAAENDSRRVAEKIADALGMKLIYSNGIYAVNDECVTSKEDNE